VVSLFSKFDNVLYQAMQLCEMGQYFSVGQNWNWLLIFTLKQWFCWWKLSLGIRREWIIKHWNYQKICKVIV